MMAFVAALLTACHDDADSPVGADGEGGAITLGTDMGTPTTRAAYSLTTPTASDPLSTLVWGSTTSMYYPDTDLIGSSSDGYQVANHIGLTFHSTYAQIGKTLMLFPFHGGTAEEVYFVGFYPTTWEPIDTRNAKIDIHGYEDVMYAPEVSGHYGGEVPVLRFYHLLTHLRFIIRCEGDTEDDREEVAYAWGRIKDICLTAQRDGTPSDKVAVNLSAAASLTEVASHTMYSNGGSTYLRLYRTGTVSTPFADDPDRSVDDPSTWYTLQSASADGEETAYVLCAPVTAVSTSGVSEYTLTLNTEKRSNVRVPIDLRTMGNTLYAGSTMGCEFTVTLTFRFGKVIASSTAMYDWSQQGGQSIVDIEDN